MSLASFIWAVIVTVAVGFEPSRGNFVEEPNDVTPTIGQSVVLRCRILGLLPSMIVSWTKDSIVISENYDIITQNQEKFRVQVDSSIGQYNFIISNVSYNDEGVYKCQVRNTNGVFLASSRRASLDIAVLPSGQPFCSIEPAIDPLHTSVQAGDEYVIKCQLETGSPPVKLTWRDSNDNIPDTDIERGEYLTQITATWVAKRHDRHMVFTCIANHAALPFNLDCTIGPFHVEYPPVIFISAEKEYVEIGGTVSFSCAADANPPVFEYSWTFNGVYVPAPTVRGFDRFRVRGGPNGNSILTIENVSFEDEKAEVKCLVRNPHGTDEKTLTLRVSAPISVLTDFSTLDNGPNTMAIFTCDSQSLLSSRRHTWYYNGELVRGSPKFTLLNDDAVLVVRKMTGDDNLAMVTCEASNGLATENSTAVLRIDPNVLSHIKRVEEEHINKEVIIAISFIAGLIAGALTVLLIVCFLWKKKLLRRCTKKTKESRAETYGGTDTGLRVEANNLNSEHGHGEQHLNVTYGDTDSMGYLQPISDPRFERSNRSTQSAAVRPYTDINKSTLEPEHEYQKLNVRKEKVGVAKRIEQFEYSLATK